MSLESLSVVEGAKGNDEIVVEGLVPSVECQYAWPCGHSGNNMRGWSGVRGSWWWHVACWSGGKEEGKCWS